MRLLKETITVVKIIIIMLFMIFLCNITGIHAQIINEKQNPITVGVLLYRFDDTYISLVRQGLEEIQKNNEDKVEFTFYDSKNDQEIQNQIIDTLIENKSVDLILLNLVDIQNPYDAINMIKENNIPVVLFNREPFTMDAVKSYNKAYFVGTSPDQAGTLEGKIIVNLWSEKKLTMDTNEDNILQYIMLIGEHNNKDAIERTEYSVLAINDSGIQTQQLASIVCDWNRELARSSFEPLFLKYGNGIEAVISNNDEMAIGAIEVLQKYGYNKGEEATTIAVVGVDAIPEAQELIKKGVMSGSVLQDAPAMAEACYAIGMNLVFNRAPLEGTQYKFDDTRVAVRIPYKEYTA